MFWAKFFHFANMFALMLCLFVVCCGVFLVLWVFCGLSGVLVCFVLWVSFSVILWLVEMSRACMCIVTTGGLMLLFVLLLVLVESHGL